MTGLSVVEFNRLLPAFKQAALGYRSELTPKRKRKIGGGRSGKLPSWEDKLVFILVYLKHYPTYDLMGFLFDRDRTKC
ncbi:MAG TPA: transposase family protein, partial [Candidatus Saccharimonadia bacterium]